MRADFAFHPTRRLVLGMAVLAFAGPAEAGDFTYVNARFGTEITFPAELFPTAEPAAENGDGMSWTSADGAWLGVWGQFNALDHDENALLEFLKPEYDEVTYAKAGRGFVVLSGMDDGKVFYLRTNFGREGVLHTMLMRYPVERKAEFNAVVGRVASSLKGP